MQTMSFSVWRVKTHMWMNCFQEQTISVMGVVHIWSDRYIVGTLNFVCNIGWAPASSVYQKIYIPDTHAATVIRKLMVHLSRSGLIDICISDNGPSSLRKSSGTLQKNGDSNIRPVRYNTQWVTGLQKNRSELQQTIVESKGKWSRSVHRTTWVSKHAVIRL